MTSIFVEREDSMTTLHLAILTTCIALATGSVHAGSCVPTNPDSAYAINGNGTVTDVRTDLMWKQCVEGQSGSNCSGTASSLDWFEALAAAQDATFAGFDDWRLPNVRELLTLVEYCNFNPAINGNYFPGTPLTSVWTGSPAIPPPGMPGNSSIIVSFANGASNESFARTNVPEFSYYSVRLVRSLQPLLRNGFESD